MKPNVLITGAGKGLGYTLSEQFLGKGWKVLAGLREKNNQTDKLHTSYQQDYIPFIMDVGSEDSVKKAFEEVGQKLDRLDVIINNAAIILPSAKNPLEELNFEDMAITHNVNSLGPLRVLKYFYPLLIKSNKKLIVNISSEAGSIANCWRDKEYDYSMSKASMNMMSRILQNYSKSKGVKVLAVHPGWMRTDMGGKEADIEASESAEGIIALVMKEWALEAPIYMDYKGNKMDW